MIRLTRGTQSRFGLKRILLLGLLFFPIGFAPARNLVTNPGFETGDTTGWIVFGAPT
jgi:hypothetical protein